MSKDKYKFKRVSEFPEHVKGACYAITDHGHTMFPEDVTRKLNQIEQLKIEIRRKDEALKEIAEFEDMECNYAIGSIRGIAREALNNKDGE